MTLSVKAFAISALNAYKRILSPLFPPACRYTPTCSEYAVEAIDRHGALRGSVMAAWRILRCNPFTAGGVDPVAMPISDLDRTTACRH